MTTLAQIIEKFDLKPHPEGGYFKETYRSKGTIAEKDLGKAYKGSRNYSTAIYFLLTSERFSAFHKIKQDEIWHFYDGSPLKIHMISEAGMYTNVIVGKDIARGEIPQYVVKGKSWFAVEVINADSFSFAGCTVSPGFDFQDFEMPSRPFLIDKFPELEDVIVRFTISDV